MSRKSKIDAVKKVEIVEKYLNGELSQKGAAKMFGVILTMTGIIGQWP